MASIKLKALQTQQAYSNTPDGNVTGREFTLKTNASGVITSSDATAAFAIGDKAYIGILDEGLRLFDCLSIVSDAFTASETVKIGFEYMDGVDDTNVPQDDDYFHAALALSAVGRTRANNNAVVPVTLPKRAYLVVTNAGADCAAAGRLDVVVLGTQDGVI